MSFPAIFQRISISKGQVRIRSMATCLYLCMDACGLLYGSVSKAFSLINFPIYFHQYECENVSRNIKKYKMRKKENYV